MEEFKIENPIPADYQIPYYVHQDDMNKLDQSHKRIEKWLVGFMIALFIALVGSNVYWIWNENQYEDVLTTVTQEVSSEGGGNAIVNDGVHYYGEGEADSNGQDKTTKNP